MSGEPRFMRKDNRYGRYQSYGSVQIMGKGNPVSRAGSGFCAGRMGLESFTGYDYHSFYPLSCLMVR